MTVHLTDTEFDDLFDTSIQALQATLDRYPDLLDWEMHGDILYIYFEDGEKVVINKQPPLHQIWLATKEGGRQFGWTGAEWDDVRGGGTWQANVQHLLKRKGIPT